MADTKIDIEGLQDFEYDDTPTDGQLEIQTSQIKEDKPPISSNDGSTSGSWFGLFSLEYYQSFFDVTTNQVLKRILAGMVPFPWKLSSVILNNPDLYGPFWLCMTLVLTTALSGNISKFFSGSVRWEFHFHEVIVLSTCIYTYTWILPVILWGFMLWRKTDDRFSLFQLLTIYGYSMSIFIPLTLLWLVNVEILRWCLLGVAILLSGSVLVQALWTPFSNETKNVSLLIMCAVFVLHAGIAIGFKYFYFRTLAVTSSGGGVGPKETTDQITTSTVMSTTLNNTHF